MSEQLTHSRLACFRACPRKHELRFELGLIPEEKDFPLRVGSAFAKAVEAHAKGLDVSAAIETELEDPYDLALVAAMFDGHRRRWEAHGLEHVAAELPFDIPLINPETGRPTPTWTLAGKIDRIVRLPDGRLALMEYKSTSSDFAPGADYWTRLHLDMQLSIYVIAARALGYDIATILYDVTRRPTLRPSQVPVLDDDGFKVVKGPDGVRVRTSDGKKWRETADAAKGYVLQTRPETPDEFAARCAASLSGNLDTDFARIEIARTDDDLRDCAGELWDQALDVRAKQKSGRWFKNPEACFRLNTRCEYVGICAMRDLATRTPDGFRRVDNVHQELIDATSGGQPAHAMTGASPSISE